MKRVHPGAVHLWRLQSVLRLFTFWGPALGALGFVVGTQVGFPTGIALGATTFGVAVVLSLAWPSLAWRAFGYELREHDLLVVQGVWFRHTVSIPLSRIQHVDTRQGPLERLWGLSNLVVYTAAGMSADGSIPALDERDAAELRDLLSRRGGDDGV